MVGRSLKGSGAGRPIFGAQRDLLETIARQHRQLALILPNLQTSAPVSGILQGSAKDIELLVAGPTAKKTEQSVKVPPNHQSLEGTRRRMLSELTSRSV